MSLTTSEVFDIIEQIAGTNSKSEKEAIIKQHSDDETFRRVLLAALNPFVTYGIRQFHEAKEEGYKDFEDIHWSMLDQLAKRVLSGGNASASVKLAMDELSPKSMELFKRVLLKDLRAGFGESTVNKAIPGLIPTFECMLAHPYSEHKHKLKFPLYVEPKLDGVRVLTFVTALGSEVKFYSRSGKEFSTFEHLKAPIREMVKQWITTNATDMQWLMNTAGGGLVIEAEVVSGSFNKTVSEVRKKDEQATDAKLYMFDLLPLATFLKQDKKGCEVAGKWVDRHARLVRLARRANPFGPLVMLDPREVNSEEEIHALYEQFRAEGLEGVIVKDPLSLYHRRRNHAWTKMKAEESEDVYIYTAIEGTGKYEGMLGAIVVDYKGVRVNVGSGFSDEQRKEFWEAFLRDREASTNDVGGIGGIGELIGRLVEVEYHEVTPDGSLRHPRFKRFRDDKLAEAA
jgi:DNA ligase 1